MKNNPYIYILIMAAVTYSVRVLPLTLIRKRIKNRLLRSFLYYVPYVTLSVMTFPAILSASGSVVSAAAALVVGIAAAFFGASLFVVAAGCSLTVFVIEAILMFV